jgi:Tol biopolymer transport system component
MGSFDLYRKVVGGGPEQLVLASHDNKFPNVWLKDGKTILFVDGKNFYRLLFEGDGKPFTLLQSEFSNDLPQLSHDEKWVAYQSNESGRWEIYLASFPTFSDKKQVSANGGCQPVWRGDGFLRLTASSWPQM